MNAQTRALFDWAWEANREQVERLLLDARVDVLARDAEGRFAADVVPVGNVTMDPEDVWALQSVATLISRAIERVLAVEVEGADAELAPQVRALVARIAPSPAENGGGTLKVRCAPATDAGQWLLTLHGDYDRPLPPTDPPWELHAEVIVGVDDSVGLREVARLSWHTS